MSDAERGNVSWSKADGIDADVMSDEKMGYAHGGSDDPVPDEMETLSSMKDEAARANKVRPALPPPPRFPSPDAALVAGLGGGPRRHQTPFQDLMRVWK